MFNRKASDPKNKPDEILKALALQQGQKVADIGAGGGYFTLRFTEAVEKDGRVFAVDTNPKFLEVIKNSAKKRGLDNVETSLPLSCFFQPSYLEGQTLFTKFFNKLLAPIITF